MANKKFSRRALFTSLLSLLLCCAMLVGTTFAWFTDSVTSTNNIIKSGNLDVELEYYDGDSWEKVVETTNVFEENTLWEPGHTEIVYLKVSNLGTLALKYAMEVNVASETAGTNVAGDTFKLSDYIYYGVIESETEKFYASRDEARKVAETDASKLNFSYVNVDKLLETDEADYVTLVVYMPESVGNEANYLTGTNAPVINLGINLFATQETYEEDSFGSDYDGEAFVPVAQVNQLAEKDITLVDDSTMTLDAAFSFRTTEDDTAAAASGYRYWHADFVVYADQDVAKDSMALAGYYDAYAQATNTVGKWIALPVDQDIPANTQIRLMEYMGVTGNYEELCTWIPEFLCGLVDLDGSNNGTTVTVELRLYETYSEEECLELFGYKSKNEETGEYTTIGVYEHTFTKEVATAAELAAAIANDTANIALGDDIIGDVTAAQKPGVNITIDGNGHTFAGVLTVDGKSATYTTAGLTIKNVVFKADSIAADACIQLGDGTNDTRYTCNVTVENCTFDVPGAVGVKSYTGGDKNLTITGCTATANCHSLIQAKGIDGVLVEKCKVYSKNGLNFNNSTNVTVDGCEVDVKGYAVRFGESSGGVGAAETYLIKNCTLKSANDDGDATIILRGTADYSTLTIENTTIVGTPDIANTATGATVVVN